MELDDLLEPAGLGVDLAIWGLAALLLQLELDKEPLLLFSVSGSGTKFLIHAFFSLCTYLNSSAAGLVSSGLGSLGGAELTLASVLTTAVLTTEVMGVASAVMAVLPSVLGSVTLCS